MDVHPDENMNITDAVSILRALDNTGICLFMYYPQTRSIIVPEKTCMAYSCKPSYTDMPHSFADDFVHPDDYATFKEMYYKIDRGESKSYSTFHSKDLNFCCGVTLTAVTWNEEGLPKEVFGIVENISEAYKSKTVVEQLQRIIGENTKDDDSVQEAVSLIANAISDVYLTIYHIWLEDFTYVSFRDHTADSDKYTGKRIACSNEYIEYYINQWAEPQYGDTLREFFALDTLPQRLKAVDSVTCVYCTKKYGWIKGEYTVAKRNSEGNITNVIFTARDINDEVEREEKKQKTLFELQHDPLTKVYNRKGFEEMTKISRESKKPVGFVMLDIDDFKKLNDTFGHEIGDMVLQHVAECLAKAFRNDDYIFRMGGDEFAILLNDCTIDVWDSFCRKQEYIHRNLHETFPKIKNITVSMGACFSGHGYYDDLMTLADEALYETKNNGRSGCTLIDSNHQILKQWRDENFTLQAEIALDRSTTGVYRMEFPDNREESPRMFCNETAKMILGVDTNATPEECYAIWEAGIEPSYVDALKEMRQTMMEEGQAECTYLWNHPVWGQIYVRSGGFGSREVGMTTLHGYHHALKNTRIIEKQDESKLLFSALNDVYFASYYLNLENNTYSTFKFAPGEDSLQMQDKTIAEIFTEFINVLVAPADREKMTEFMNFDTLQQRLGTDKSIDCEYRSQALKRWCRARLIPVKYNQNGKLTHVLFAIGALDSTKAKELDVTDYNRRSLTALFNNVPGGVVMYEWDGEHIKTLHITECYKKQYGYTLLSHDKSNPGGPDFKRVHPDDLADYKEAIEQALNETHYLNYTYRIWSNEAGRYLWVRIDATVNPQPEGTSLIYAIYTDVTEQKDAELSSQKKQASLETALDMSDQICCEYDPKTHIMECLTDDNYFKLPKVLHNYPECMRDYDFIHSEDMERFMETANSVDGSNTVQCDIRCQRDGEYRWYSCKFSPYYDSEKERNIAIYTMYDITLRVEAMHSCEERLRSLLATK